MQISVNGEIRQVVNGTTIVDLLDVLSIPRNKVAVERNLEIVAKSQYEQTCVQEGDRYEIVHFIGGG